ncbi:exo-beta-N-acetylmuramidase NamZ family protein [Hyunsoonleella rubra]|uniref:Exo-beta-N-acetylmuramidase NamZ domain-containing protein n=1 Tax=Hyunsoonleella rubra TaxID=1737062 RepID=A0ABW5TEV0_9FLAO
MEDGRHPDSYREAEVEKSDETLKQSRKLSGQGDRGMVVGANRTELYSPILKGKRVGVVANQTSVVFHEKPESLEGQVPEVLEGQVPEVLEGTDSNVLSSRASDNTRASDNKRVSDNNYTHLVDSLLSLNIDIKKVFAPEHGFRGKADAGAHVEDGFDTKTNLPIISLHGKYRKPTQEALQDLDIVIFDIQDVGVRFYTYISTLHNVMEACAEAKIPVLIFDRPNPNGHYIDGPTMQAEHTSFLGMHTIPLVHGMTIGEYAQMINGENWLADNLQCEITVIPVKHYTHQRSYSLPIRPSPNLPNDKSIELYPSLGLFEGTNINAGRGTEFQFQRYGAPFLDKKVMSFTYTPVANFGAKYPKHKGTLCYGEDLQNEVVNGEMTLKWVIKTYQNSTDKSKFFNTDNFTKHAGTEELQKQIEAGISETEIKATWQEDLEAFKLIRTKYLIYP